MFEKGLPRDKISIISKLKSISNPQWVNSFTNPKSKV